MKHFILVNMDYSDSSGVDSAVGARRETRPVSRRGFREYSNSGSAVSRYVYRVPSGVWIRDYV